MGRLAFGGYLCGLRRAHGLSRDTTGQMIAASPAQLARWEHGHAMPRRPALTRLLDALGGSAAVADEMLVSDLTADEGQEVARRQLVRAARADADDLVLNEPAPAPAPVERVDERRVPEPRTTSYKVRLTPDEREGLHRVAERFQRTDADLLRLIVRSLMTAEGAAPPEDAWIPWRDACDERQLKEIEFARLYGARFGHGTSGHLAYTVIATLADALDAAERMLLPGAYLAEDLPDAA